MEDETNTATPQSPCSHIADLAEDLARAYAAAYAVAVRVNLDGGSAHFAALKAMELATRVRPSPMPSR